MRIYTEGGPYGGEEHECNYSYSYIGPSVIKSLEYKSKYRLSFCTKGAAYLRTGRTFAGLRVYEHIPVQCDPMP